MTQSYVGNGRAVVTLSLKSESHLPHVSFVIYVRVLQKKGEIVSILIFILILKSELIE